MTPRRTRPRPPTLGPRGTLGILSTFGILALLALTGCGADDTGTVSQGELPSGSATASVSGSAEPAPSESATTEPSPSEPAPSETTPTESAPTESSEPRLIVYAGGESPGIEVHDRADAEDLRGAPAGFKQFIGRTAQRIADDSTCKDGYVGVTVQKLRTDGYATGGVNDCGGYRAMWAVVDGSWTEVAGTQEMWGCAVLERYHVPSDVAGPHCYDYDAQKERDYEAS